MMIIAPTAFHTMPWKNGGGITHEVLKQKHRGRLLWRLSVAEVDSDGPFSLFPGLSRILTVIKGDGLELKTESQVLRARPFTPLAFSGDWPVVAYRVGGRVKDFNVIFDAAQVAATVVALMQGGTEILAPLPGGVNAMLCLAAARVNGFEVASGSLVVARKTAMAVAFQAPALRVSISGV